MCLHGLAGHGRPPQVAFFNNDPVPKQIDSIYENRLRQFIDEGKYKDLNLPKFYDLGRIDHVKDNENLDKGYIQFKVHEVIDSKSRPLFKDVIIKDIKWKDAHKGDLFGPSWKTFWFKFHIRVPKKWINEKQVWFQWDSSSEALIYTNDGLPLQAFTSGDRNDFIIPKEWQDGEDHVFYIEMSCNGMFGVGAGSDIAPPDPNRYFRLNIADLMIPGLEARALKHDYHIISDAAREFPGDQWQKFKARQVCTAIIEAFNPNDYTSVLKCREIATTYLGKSVDSEQVYKDEGPNGNKIDVYGIGNCHIDTAWLWPFGETRRKIVRSWTTQLNLLERYSEYQFVASQAQQFKWLEQDHPRIFNKLKDFVTKGKFIPIGGSWVEHDTNMPNGESLVRQFVYGQRFFESRFGFRSNTFWLPDTFGYSSQIPQLCRLAGLDRFLTQKLSWNNINNFPNTTFNWVSLDGTQVLTHMPPANTYTADANFGDVKRSLSQHKNLTYDQSGLLLFGKGDGGGGPQPEMLERLRRCRGISNTVGLLPTVHLGKNVTDFYDDIIKNTNNGKNLVSWMGELYFEFHRGTYTSQSLVKKLMRKSEIKLHDLEYFATIASIVLSDYKYPKKELDEIWEDVLLCQFHDVLPGSCSEMVYKDDVHPKLNAAVKKSENLIIKALQALSSTSGNETSLKLISTLQWDLQGIFKIPTQLATGLFTQAISKKISYVYGSTSKGKFIAVSKVKYPASIIKQDGLFILSNSKLKVTIDGGVLTSVYDLVLEREYLDVETGSNTTGGNQLILLEDTPLDWQAWDTEVYSNDKITNIAKGKVQINEEGPLRTSVLVTQKISETSEIKTIISLNALNSLDEESYITFDSKVHWNESCKFLKVEFPVKVHNDFASYETQFGITKRPTHYNTSWDVAKFEVCHHKFLDYSDYSHGVSLFNDSKYGASVHGNLIRLSLLRSPKEPDAHADIGDHHFKYALYPHKGQLSSKTIELAHGFNYNSTPYFVYADDSLTKALQLVQLIGDSNLVLSNIKRAEDDADISTGELPVKIDKQGSKSVIVRVYESLGGEGIGELVFTGDLKKIYKVNLLEDELEELKIVNNGSKIKLRPFEVASYKLVFK